MRLTQKAIDMIKAQPIERLGIAKALLVSDQTLLRYLKNNDKNLTKADALIEIRKVTGLNDEEILEESGVAAGHD